MNRAESSLTKRVVSFMLSAAMTTAVFVNTVPAALAASASVTDTLNVRSGPGTGYQIVKTISKGTVVETLDSGSGGWMKIKLSDGTQGYCSSQYLKVSSANAGGSSSSGGSSSTYGTLTMDTRSYTMAPGNIYDFRAKVEGMGFTQSDVKVYSSRTGIAALARVPGTDKYRITGLKEGVCYVVAEVGGVHASIKVTVQKGVKAWGESTRSISLLGNHPNLPSDGNNGNPSGGGQTSAFTLDTKSYQFASAGKVYQFLAKGIAKGTTPTATSSDPSVVSVSLKNANDARGYLYEIKSLKAGAATITIANGNYSAQMIASVSGGSSDSGSGGQTSALVLDTKSYQFASTGKAYQFLAKGIATGTTPTATSSDPSVVSVSLKNANDSRGYLYEIKSLSAGSSTITVTSGSYSAQMPVTVTGSGGNTSPEAKRARTTTSVNLRSEPNTDCSKLALLGMGTVVDVLDTSNSQWTQVKTSGGQVGYIFNDYIEFLSGDDTSSNVSGLKLSHTSGTIPQGKSYYITATVQPSGSAVTWKSSNANVATVSNGFIYGNQPGSAVITATAGSSTVSCKVTVTAAEPIKAAYTSPNIAGVGQQVQLVAVTDNARSSVRFVVKMSDGSQRVLDTSNYTSESATGTGLAPNNTRVWRATTSFSSSGTYQVTAYSSTGGSSYSSTGVTTNSFVVSTQDKSVSTAENRRVSDEMLTLIGKWEGYSAAVYPDTLAHNIPTIGYGQTFGAGALFYNNLTKTEAWAQLLNSVNGSYTQAVNTFITRNNVKANQYHFDAMVSFSYNVGAAYWNGSSAFDIREIMLNSVVPPSGQTLSARATLNFDLYASPMTNGGRLTEVAADASLTVLQTSVDSSTKSVWYQVQTQDGTVGWARNGYIRLDNASGMQRDLNYTDAQAIATEWLRWNQAGGKVYAGLVYRRLGEAKVFAYGNYSEADSGSANYKKNTYGFTYPISAQPYEQ